MLVVAHSEGRMPLYGYASLAIHLLDQNDNPPSFSQEHYVSSVWEGNNKGTFVTQVLYFSFFFLTLYICHMCTHMFSHDDNFKRYN